MRKAKFKVSLTVALTQKLYDEIKALSDEATISMGEFVRNLLDEALRTHHFNEELGHEN